ncbi:MAG: hypothetical protein ACKOAU_20995 [Pirellula sp.]
MAISQVSRFVGVSAKSHARKAVYDCLLAAIFWLLCFWTPVSTMGQNQPYDVFPEAKPPYFRVRLEPSSESGELIYGANFTIWIPPGVDTLRGIVVHQHGCGEGSCKSGLTGAYDLHWQALAKKHHCALLSPVYEQPEKADCQMWCDPRKGSAKAFLRALDMLAQATGQGELTRVPWALWGHSGGGHWCGGMAMLYPQRTVAAWLRSGVPLVEPIASRGNIQNYSIHDGVLSVPLMCNVGTKEGVTVQDERFGSVWPANLEFFNNLRSRGALIATSVDPLTSHECGNQRYLAIPWLDECLKQRLPDQPGQPMKPMNATQAWLVSHGSDTPVSAQANSTIDDSLKWSWLPSERFAKLWTQYSKDSSVADETPPPAPTDLVLNGESLQWACEADLESGLAYFVIELDGKEIGRVPDKNLNPFGRQVFQGLQYSDTPPQPLMQMQYQLKTSADAAGDNPPRNLSVHSVNTVGRVSTKTQVMKQPTGSQ